MKCKFLIISLILCTGTTAISESIISQPVQKKRSAIQSTNAEFKEHKIDTASNAYFEAIKEIEAKLSQTDDNYIYYVSLVDLYIKTSQFDKAYKELTFLNNLAKAKFIGA